MPRPDPRERYYNDTAEKPPHKLLVKALGYLQPSQRKVLDVGAGALRDSKYLLSLGCDVTALDTGPTFDAIVEREAGSGIHFINSRFEAFKPVDGQYDFITSMFALSFCPAADFAAFFESLIKSLNKDGVLSGNIFGVNDEWNVPGTKQTFLSEAEIRELLEDMDILFFEESEADSVVADGSPKHWHAFNFIAREASLDI